MHIFPAANVSLLTFITSV